MGPARDVALRDGSRKAVGVTNHPVCKQTTAAAAGHAKFFLVDVAALDRFIDPGHQVFEIVAGVVVLDDIAEFLTVTRAAARIWKQHHVAFRRHPLKLVKESVTVGGVRPAVDIQYQRVLFRRAEIRRLLQPGFDHFSVEALVMNLFRLGQIQFREQLVVEMGELLLIGAVLIGHEQIDQASWRGKGVDQFRTVTGRAGSDHRLIAGG